MSATVDVETETAWNVVSVPIQVITVRDFAKDRSAANNENSDTSRVGTTADEGVLIPRENLRKVVFVVQDGKAIRRAVETGISDNTHIQILSGINTGEEIVTGSYRTLSRDLNDGDKIKINNNKFSQFITEE